MTTLFASAPGKIILFGEHAVNRRQPALVTAFDRRVHCRATVRNDDQYSFTFGVESALASRTQVLAFKIEIDGLRAAEKTDELRALTRGDFFAPVRYVLAHVIERVDGPGLDVEWRSELPIGSGMGSGAAASTALAFAAIRAAGRQPEPQDVAWLAWQGDIIAHGGVASGLDSGACALGGLVRYTLVNGPEAVPLHANLPLVIGDTLVRASTADVNTRVRLWLQEQPYRMHLFAEIGILVDQALHALDAVDLDLLGHLMNLNQLVLEKIGVASLEIGQLIQAALGAGALGAKLSGSGGGGIIVALVSSERQCDVAAAIDAAGGRSLVVAAGVDGVREEQAGAWEQATV
jgi:mevalonate kinase